MKQKLLIFLLGCMLCSFAPAPPALKIARLKYNGGGDWYANKTSLPNLIQFCKQELKVNLNPEEDVVEVGSPDIFNYPFVHLTGHGNIILSNSEAQNLRNYLKIKGNI